MDQNNFGEYPPKHQWNYSPGGIFDPAKPMDETLRLAMIAGMHPLEHNRQTGRTSRMMLAAANHANSGAKTQVVFKDECAAKVWCDRFGHIPNLTIRSMKRSEVGAINWVEWADLRRLDGIDTFVDHDVLFIEHKAIFKAYAEFDLPLTAAKQAA